MGVKVKLKRGEGKDRCKGGGKEVEMDIKVEKK